MARLVSLISLVAVFFAVPVTASAQQPVLLTDELVVTSTRIGVGLPGASTTIIDADTIARSPARTLPDLLGLEAGVQTRDLFGGTGAARATVDLRGFGATAKQNTLVLVDGRRLNDIDLAAIDYANIPLAAIERIEIIRGNAGGVLYGDGAVGGVINIVTRSPDGAGTAGAADGALGSYGHREGNLSAETSAGSFSASAYGSYIGSDGYRDNNELKQRNLVTELRYRGDSGDAFFRLGLDDQSLGLPGARIVSPTQGIDQMTTDRRGTDTPEDFAKQNGIAAAGGFTRWIGDRAELIVDMGVRRKDQEAFLVSPFAPAFNQLVETDLTTWSATPRLSIDHSLGGMSARSIVGIDYYYSDYNSDRKNGADAPPFHRYNAYQHTAAAYAQNTLALSERTDAHFGFRLQYQRVAAGDVADTTAPGGAFAVQADSLDAGETEYALNAGLEYRVADSVAVFGRIGRSFRLPTLDERIGTTGTALQLRTQTSRDVEAGTRIDAGPLHLQSSIFYMKLRDEIRFSPATFANENFDPTRRIGVENTARLRLSEDVDLRGSLTWMRAEFTEGPFEGNDVPLVSEWTASTGVFWNILGERLTVGATASYYGPKRLENDESETFSEIPGYAVIDLKLGGAYEGFDWSAQVNNLFDESYFDYGVASTFTPGRYAAYPQPGRTFLVRAGVQF